MPAIWGLPPLASSIEGDEAVRLSTGVTVDLSEFNIRLGKKPSAKMIADMVAKVQVSMDHIVPLAGLPDDEPTKTMTGVQLAVQYGGRVFLDGANIVNRSTRFSFTWEGGRLVPRWERVR